MAYPSLYCVCVDIKGKRWFLKGDGYSLTERGGKVFGRRGEASAFLRKHCKSTDGFYIREF